MAINVSQAFHRTSANAVDDTLTLTKAEMLAINDNLMPSKYLSVCQDDGYIYLYDKSATPNSTTGKFTKFEGGGGTSDYPELTNKPSIEGVTLSGNKSASDLGLAKSTDIPSTSDCYKTGDTAFTAIDDADYVPVYDSSASTKKKSLWSNIKSVLKTYFDGYYQKILTAGNNIAISNANVISTTTSLSLNYSTSEQAIGKWIDGKTLYQKTINFGTLPNNTTKSVDVGVSSTINIFYLNAVAVNSNNSVININDFSADFSKIRRIYYNGNNKKIEITTKQDDSALTCYITIQYTKI